MHHVCRVIATPWPGVFGTDIDSDRHYDRHWHTTFGMGFIERGAHRSMSGRGMVDAQAGDVVTSNPGEVHDGRPLGGPSRRWRMVYLEPGVMASMSGAGGAAAVEMQLTRPVIEDRRLASVLRRLLQRLERWSASREPSARTDSRARSCSCSRVDSWCATIRPRLSTGKDEATSGEHANAWPMTSPARRR